MCEALEELITEAKNEGEKKEKILVKNVEN